MLAGVQGIHHIVPARSADEHPIGGPSLARLATATANELGDVTGDSLLGLTEIAGCNSKSLVRYTIGKAGCMGR